MNSFSSRTSRSFSAAAASLQARGHQAGIAGVLDQVVEQGGEVAGLGLGHDQALADARGDGPQVGLAELVEQARVAGEDDREDGARVEVGRRQQAGLAEHRGQQLLRLVDQHHGPHAGLLDMGKPALAQVLEAGPPTPR